MKSHEQFANDYLMVVRNDYIGWNHHLGWAQEMDLDVTQLANLLQENYETFVTNALGVLDHTGDDYRVNVLREVLLGWGDQPFRMIATEIIEAIRVD